MKSYSLVNQNYLKINKKLTFFQLWIKHVDNARAAEYSLSSKLPNNKDIIHQFCQVPDRSALNFFIVTQSAKFVDIMYTYRKKEPQNSGANFYWQKSWIVLLFLKLQCIYFWIFNQILNLFSSWGMNLTESWQHWRKERKTAVMSALFRKLE